MYTSFAYDKADSYILISFQYAVKAGRPDIVDLLLNAGADPRQVREAKLT